MFATFGHAPGSLVFDSAGDLFVVSNNQILEFAAGSSSSTVFASSVGVSTTLNSYLAISNEDLVGPPEPGTWTLFATGGLAVLVGKRKWKRWAA